MYAIDSRARAAFGTLLPRLLAWHLEHLHVSDDELADGLEEAFGEEISRTVCRQLGIDHGACLAIAAELLREDSIVIQRGRR